MRLTKEQIEAGLRFLNLAMSPELTADEYMALYYLESHLECLQEENKSRGGVPRINHKV